MSESSAVARICGFCGTRIETHDIAIYRGGGFGPPYHARCYPATRDAVTALTQRVESLEARLAHLERNASGQNDCT